MERTPATIPLSIGGRAGVQSVKMLKEKDMKTIIGGVFNGKPAIRRTMPTIDRQEDGVYRTLYLTTHHVLEVRTYRFDGLNFKVTRVPVEHADAFLN